VLKSLAAILFCAVAASASAQETPVADAAQPNLFGLFNSLDELKAELPRADRCPLNRPSDAEKEACALIIYKPVSADEGAYAFYFRPIFLVTDRGRAWTAFENRIRAIPVERLFEEITLPNKLDRTVRDRYMPFAIIGNVENENNRSAGRSALPHDALFRNYVGSFEPADARQIWRR
jgi:hypothetical protein